MRTGDHILNCSIAIGHRRDGQPFVTYGTAFVFAIHRETLAFSYLITACHVIENIPGDWVWIRGNWKDTGLAMSLKIAKDRFKFHPDHNPTNSGEYIDISVALFFERHFEHTWLCEEDYLTDAVINIENIGVGDEVVTVGMFYSVPGERQIIPIVRIGNIAAMPNEPIPSKYGYMDGILVETRSISGLSGSPVMVHMGLRPPVERRGPLPLKKKNHYLLGLMQGYYSVMAPGESTVAPASVGDEFMNAGIAFVTPVKRIWETLARQDFEDYRLEWIDRHFRGKRRVDPA